MTGFYPARARMMPLAGFLVLQLLTCVSAYTPSPPPPTMNRRSLLSSWIASMAVLASAQPSFAATDTANLEDVYFGVGCFWHIQHEFVQAERQLLGRDDHQLTSRAGYAGGTQTDQQGRVCYHNMQFIADYGKLGHGEVVGIKLPTDKIADFADVYFSLFDARTKDRVDPQDRGGEYRSLIGLPGGQLHDAYPRVEEIASRYGFRLAQGKGNDGDTLGKQLVYVYDTAQFPFQYVLCSGCMLWIE